MRIVKEIVLPSGRFAAIREASFSDIQASYSENGMLTMANLAALLVTIDGEPITTEALDRMSLSDAMLIINTIAEIIKPALTAKAVS